MAASAEMLDGDNLSVERITALAQGPLTLTLAEESWRRIAAGREIVERALRSGAPIYGATTGVGSQKDVQVGAAQLSDFSDRMIISEATDFPGELFPQRVVRAALLVLINNVARGRTGLRPVVAEQLLRLAQSATLPAVRRDSSYGGADLTPLSQLALALLGSSIGGVGGSMAGSALKLAPKESSCVPPKLF